jgi:hypothetical protein
MHRFATLPQAHLGAGLLDQDSFLWAVDAACEIEQPCVG